MMGMLKRLARRILNGPALTAAETAEMLGYDETDIPSLVRQDILTPVIEGKALFDRPEVGRVKRERDERAARLSEYYRTSDFLNEIGVF